jgi:hypothetical protein
LYGHFIGPLIPKDKRSGLLTRIATQSASSRVPMKCLLRCWIGRGNSGKTLFAYVQFLNVLLQNELSFGGKSLNEINAAILVLKPQIIGISLFAIANADESLCGRNCWCRLLRAHTFVEANFSNPKFG